jgi:hypothetical protein
MGAFLWVKGWLWPFKNQSVSSHYLKRVKKMQSWRDCSLPARVFAVIPSLWTPNLSKAGGLYDKGHDDSGFQHRNSV